MRRAGFLFVILFATAWVLTLSCDVQAQKRGGKSGQKSETKKRSEDAVKGEEKKAAEQSQSAEGAAQRKKEMKGEVKQGGEAKKYKPKGLKDEEMKQWEGGRPPGWSMGTKKGWGEGDAPPGKMKAGDEAKLEQAKERIRNRIRTHEGKGEMERKQLEEHAERSIEGAARMGVPVEHAERAVEKGIESGMSGEGIEKMTRAMAYGADKGTDYDELGTFMDKRMAAGERDDELAMSVYKEIDDRQAEREKVQEQPKKKEPWYKRIFKRG